MDATDEHADLVDKLRWQLRMAEQHHPERRDINLLHGTDSTRLDSSTYCAACSQVWPCECIRGVTRQSNGGEAWVAR
jgi:hypothetical protein